MMETEIGSDNSFDILVTDADANIYFKKNLARQIAVEHFSDGQKHPSNYIFTAYSPYIMHVHVHYRKNSRTRHVPINDLEPA